LGTGNAWGKCLYSQVNGNFRPNKASFRLHVENGASAAVIVPLRCESKLSNNDAD